MSRYVIKRDDISKWSQVYLYVVQTRVGITEGVPGDEWISGYRGLPQSKYRVLGGPYNSLDKGDYAGSYFPSLSPNPKVALEEYKEWEDLIKGK